MTELKGPMYTSISHQALLIFPSGQHLQKLDHNLLIQDSPATTSITVALSTAAIPLHAYPFS